MREKNCPQPRNICTQKINGRQHLLIPLQTSRLALWNTCFSLPFFLAKTGVSKLTAPRFQFWTAVHSHSSTHFWTPESHPISDSFLFLPQFKFRAINHMLKFCLVQPMRRRCIRLNCPTHPLLEICHFPVLPHHQILLRHLHLHVRLPLRQKSHLCEKQASDSAAVWIAR